MNHLVGLAVPAVEVPPEERDALEELRAAYLALPDADVSLAPTFAAPPHLPPSGWRALDDCTLLRFLRADKGDVSTALARMQQTFEWRAGPGAQPEQLPEDW